MNKKIITHGLIIAAIVISAFAAYAKTTEASAIANIAKIDYENRTLRTSTKQIIDNEIPLAAAPSETAPDMSFAWLVVAAAALMTGIVSVFPIQLIRLLHGFHLIGLICTTRESGYLLQHNM